MTEPPVPQTPAPLPEPTDPPPVPETPDPPAELTIAEHAKQFSPDAAKDDDAPEGETAEERTQRHHSVQQKRERETGKFEPGKVRHRAQSQQAGARDVPRIQQLTGRAKTAEERLAAAEAEIARLKSAPLAPPQTFKKGDVVTFHDPRLSQPGNGEAHREPATPQDPEPTEADQKYGGDYGKYLVDHARWAARDEHRKWETQQEQKAQQARQHEAQRKTLETFGQRIAVAKQKYPDFEAVAFGPTTIPAGSPVDAWIMEDDAGAEILYHLHAHPEELDSLLRMSVLQQVKHLSLLSQRLLPDTPAQAGLTGSAAGTQTIVLPPRPPNPVRTEAHARVEGPPTDRPLSIAEHDRYYGPKARR